ncbi:hypothetical protein [Pararhodospirillum photometricum]|uniref:hypothetical protein n=1 Tax=Pararhodospirillum photometricum TaxID=1084 RepID=UPI0002DB6406|nr:hypothetical protein [Pararhodospirillum photometricum]
MTGPYVPLLVAAILSVGWLVTYTLVLALNPAWPGLAVLGPGELSAVIAAGILPPTLTWAIALGVSLALSAHDLPRVLRGLALHSRRAAEDVEALGRTVIMMQEQARRRAHLDSIDLAFKDMNAQLAQIMERVGLTGRDETETLWALTGTGHPWAFADPFLASAEATGPNFAERLATRLAQDPQGAVAVEIFLRRYAHVSRLAHEHDENGLLSGLLADGPLDRVAAVLTGVNGRLTQAPPASPTEPLEPSAPPVADPGTPAPNAPPPPPPPAATVAPPDTTPVWRPGRGPARDQDDTIAREAIEALQPPLSADPPERPLAAPSLSALPILSKTEPEPSLAPTEPDLAPALQAEDPPPSEDDLVADRRSPPSSPSPVPRAPRGSLAERLEPGPGPGPRPEPAVAPAPPAPPALPPYPRITRDEMRAIQERVASTLSRATAPPEPEDDDAMMIEDVPREPPAHLFRSRFLLQCQTAHRRTGNID